MASAFGYERMRLTYKGADNLEKLSFLLGWVGWGAISFRHPGPTWSCRYRHARQAHARRDVEILVR